MRRLAIIGTAIAALVLAGVAYAAFNNYTGSSLKISSGTGTKSKPVALSMVQHYQANAPSGDRAAPLTNITFKIWGVKMDFGKLPTCSDSQVLSNKTSPMGGCPAGSLIGGGAVHSELGPSTSPSASAGTACNPYLNVFNGGPSTTVNYFYTKSATDCGGLTTGATAPYDGHVSYSGGWAIVNTPLPPDISTKVANQPGLYGSLITESLTFAKKAAGKIYMAGEGCKKGKRPWSIKFTATDYNSGSSETATVTGSAKC